MNLFTLNGGTLNGGSRLFVVAATAALVCSASVSVSATRIQDALAPSLARSTLVADATKTHGAEATPLTGSGLVVADGQHTTQGYSTITGNANLLAFVIRGQTAAAYITGSANLLSVPASTFANSNVSGAAAVTVDATKIQPGRSQANTAALVTISSAPTITRYVQAHSLGGMASLRVEPTINGVAGAYGAMPSCATVEATGVVTRPGTALLLNTATVVSAPTHIKPGSILAYGPALIVVAEPKIITGFFARVNVGASAQAIATVNKIALATLTGHSVFAVKASQTFGSTKASLAGSSVLVANAVVDRRVAASMQGRTTIDVFALRTHQAQSYFSSNALVTSTARRTTFAEANITTGATNVVAQARQTVREGLAEIAATGTLQVSATDITRYVEGNVFCGCSVVAATVLMRIGNSHIYAAADVAAIPTVASNQTVYQGSAGMQGAVDLVISAQVNRKAVGQLSGIAQVTPDATRITHVFVSVNGGALVLADTIANASSIDPQERTFIRPVMATEFVRPFIESEFRRAA